MLSRLTAALVAAGLLVLTACAQQTLSPEEIHQRQNEIIKEVSEKYGFPDASIRIIAAGTTAPPVIKNGEITEQQVSVRIGEQRPGDVGECHGVLLWRLHGEPDLMQDTANLVLIQANTTHQKVKENAELLGLADCFK